MGALPPLCAAARRDRQRTGDDHIGGAGRQGEITMLALNTITMSSREIAELCAKQHFHVMRDIRDMLDQLGIQSGGYIQKWVHPQNGQEYEEYRLPKDLTVTLITGYRADLRYKVVKRLEELEAGGPVPKTMAEALRLAADQIERAEAAEKSLALAAPKAAVFDQMVECSDTFSIRDAAKAVGMPERKFAEWLRDKGYIHRSNGVWAAYAEKLWSGQFAHKVRVVNDGEKTVTQCRITAKGLALIKKRLIE